MSQGYSIVSIYLVFISFLETTNSAGEINKFASYFKELSLLKVQGIFLIQSHLHAPLTHDTALKMLKFERTSSPP